MTRQEKAAIRTVAARIKELAGMENCGVDFSGNSNLRHHVELYLTWFTSTANYLEELADAEDKEAVQDAVSQIERYCR